MKKFIKTLCVVFFIFITITYSCKKDEVPTLTTSEINNITGTTATAGGVITDEGSGSVIAKGVCYGTSTNPTIEDNITSDGTGAGTFTSNITGLNGAKTYFLRAYATNSAGTAYGATKTFTTLGTAPSVVTNTVTTYFTTTATLEGEVNANYLSTVVTFEYGTTTNYGISVTAIISPVTGNVNTADSVILTGLVPGTTYHFRIKAVNELGTTYGEDKTFVPGLAGLVAYYNFNDNIEDQTANSNDGTAFGGVFGSDGAYVFDGIDDYIKINNNASLNPTEAITISLWFKPVEYTGSGYEALVLKPYTSHTGPVYQYIVGMAGSYTPSNQNCFAFNINVNGVNKGVNSGANAWTAENWYHVVGTYDGQTLKLFVNGILKKSLVAEGSMTSYDTDLYLAKQQNIGTTTPGTMDNVRIYNRALSEEEILLIYNQEAR